MSTSFSYSFAGNSSKSCIIAYYYMELVYHDYILTGQFFRGFVCPFSPKVYSATPTFQKDMLHYFTCLVINICRTNKNMHMTRLILIQILIHVKKISYSCQIQ